MNSVLIVIPALNEERNIANVLRSIRDADLAADILVINDGSEDETENIARQFGVEVVSHPYNMGYGSALQTSFKYATREGYHYIVQFDADGQHNVKDVDLLLDAIGDGQYDVLLGSRFLGDHSFHPGWHKMIVIYFFRGIIRLLASQRITDPTSGFRAISRRVFKHYSRFNQFPSDFPDADIIIDVLLRKWVVREVPIHHARRAAGKSMHSGLKPVVYVFKIILSILVVVINVRLQKRGEHS